MAKERNKKNICQSCPKMVWETGARCKSCVLKGNKRNRELTPEIREKMIALLPRGENHWKWIKDRKKVKTGERSLNDPLQKGWRKAVKTRDGWTCKIADENCSGKLEAHHILPWSKFPELRYQINNGITLCHAHHPRKKEDVAKLSPYFQSIVASRG